MITLHHPFASINVKNMMRLARTIDFEEEIGDEFKPFIALIRGMLNVDPNNRVSLNEVNEIINS